jgi:hypothetical protein
MHGICSTSKGAHAPSRRFDRANLTVNERLHLSRFPLRDNLQNEITPPEPHALTKQRSSTVTVLPKYRISRVQSMPQANSQLSPPDDIANMLYVILSRLRIYVAMVEQSLRTEFLDSPNVVKDWLNTVGWLQDVFFPVYQLLQAPSTDTEEAQHRLASLNQRLSDARNLLLIESQSNGDRLFGVLGLFRQIRAGLDAWKTDLGREIGQLDSDALLATCKIPNPVTAPSAIGPLQAGLAEAQTVIETQDDVAICMILRRVFFLLYYISVISPNYWTSSLHNAVLDLHERALDVIGPGLARTSVEARICKLRRFDRFSLEQIAFESVA